MLIILSVYVCFSDLLHDLEKCNANPVAIAKCFVAKVQLLSFLFSQRQSSHTYDILMIIYSNSSYYKPDFRLSFIHEAQTVEWLSLQSRGRTSWLVD